MASANLYTNTGQSSGDVQLSEDLFGADVNGHVLYESVKSYLANQRQGTHKTKNRHEVAGQKTKIYRQKGTGRARAGSSTAGNRVGGGRIHGTSPRDYSYALPKKVRRLALKSALSDRAQEAHVHVVEDLDLTAPSTRTVIGMLAGMGLQDRKVLVVAVENDRNLVKSCRNLRKVEVLPANEVNAYQVLHSDDVIVMKSALARMEEVFGE
jgi:large subunit ribosomal protein L4